MFYGNLSQQQKVNNLPSVHKSQICAHRHKGLPGGCQSYQNLTILEKYFQGYNVGKTNKTKRKTQAFLPLVAFVEGNTGCPAHLSKQRHIGRLHSATPERCLLRSSERFLKVCFSARITLIYY